jgi:hypothetical protein
MMATLTVTTTVTTPKGRTRSITVAPTIRRAGMLAIVTAAAIVGFMATGAQATSLGILHNGADLTRVMRFLAAIKGAMAIAGAVWRLGATVSLPWFAAYAVSGVAMAAGPGLIWGMSHIVLGALLLHLGLFATIILLWRDPVVGARLETIIAARRRQIAARTG